VEVIHYLILLSRKSFWFLLGLQGIWDSATYGCLEGP